MSLNTTISKINVINRNNEIQKLDFNKILNRIQKLINLEPKLNINADYIAIQTISKLVNNIKTSEIDNISANICSSLVIEDVEYDTLASRIVISNLHKQTSDNIIDYLTNSATYTFNNKVTQLLGTKFIKIIQYNSNIIDKWVNYNKDYTYSYPGIMQLMKSYLIAHKYNDIKIIKERPQQMLIRVAFGINLNKFDDNGKVINKNDLEHIQSTYELLSNKYYTHATPTLFNAGTMRNSFSSCFLLSVDDNLNNIVKRNADFAQISKFSGGIGAHVSGIRSKGSIIKSTNGKSPGVLPMLKMFNATVSYISQGGGKRNGSAAIYIEPWHPDIFDCLESQKNQASVEYICESLYLAIWMPNLFIERAIKSIETKTPIMWSLMDPGKCHNLNTTHGAEFNELYINYENKKMYNSQVPVLELFNLICKLQIETGKPYISFKDHVNDKCNQNNLGTIRSSNLCVHGDTKILTYSGYFHIKDLVNKEVMVWNGVNFKPALIQRTSSNATLLNIKVSDGNELNCTYYHKFKIIDTFGKIIEVIANDLQVGDKLLTCEYPISNFTVSSFYYNGKDVYTHGFYCGNDIKKLHNNKDNQIILYSKYAKYTNKLFYDSISQNNICINLHLNDKINDRFKVPDYYPADYKLDWLMGYLDADVNIAYNENYPFLYTNSTNKPFLIDVQLMLNTLGLKSTVTSNNKRYKWLTFDNEIFTLTINKYYTQQLFNFKNFKLDRLNYKYEIYKYNLSKLIKSDDILTVTAKHKVFDLHDTYCFNEPELHMGVFNGILTMNCNEINIYTDENNIGVCNLASICLPKFVEINQNSTSFNYNLLNNIVQTITINMNSVIDNNEYPSPEAKHSDDMNKPIGIGVQGLSEVFMMFKEPYTSNKSRLINKHIFETIYFAALTASNNLAKKYGPYKNFHTSMTARGILQFDLWGVTPSSGLWNWDELKNKIKKYGLYNSLLIALMPTASTSIIMNHTECIEPPQSNLYTRTTVTGTFQIVNKYLIDDLKQLNLWNQVIINKINNNNGSVHGINEIPKYIQDIYSTAYEYKVKDMVQMDADRSAYVCQASSSNRYIKDPTINKLISMHIHNWKLGLKTSSYYTRTMASNNAAKLNISIDTKPKEIIGEECTMCTA